LIKYFFSKTRWSFFILVIVLLRLLDNYLLWILCLSLWKLVELRWIVSWLRSSSIKLNWLPITLILNRLILNSLVGRKWSTGWVTWLGKLRWNWIFNCNRNFLLFSFLILRRCLSFINNNRLLLINNIGSSISYNASYNTKTEEKTHCWIERNHKSTCSKIWGCRVIVAMTWIITKIIIIIIISWDKLVAA
jgi:hypothetical protein